VAIHFDSRIVRILFAVLLVVGAVLIVVPGTLVVSRTWFMISSRAGTLSSQQLSAGDDWSEEHLHGCNKRKQIDSLVKFTIDENKTLSVGDSCLITASYRVEKVTFLYTECQKTQKFEFPPDERLKEYIERALSRTGFVLALAGADVAPAGRNFPHGNTLAWSVKPKEAGHLVGTIVQSKPANEQEEVEELNSGIGAYLQQSPTVRITALATPFQGAQVLSWIPKFLGTLLTLPGILAFLREYRVRKEAKRLRELEQRKIIIPGFLE
jgi:hypothetical protein